MARFKPDLESLFAYFNPWTLTRWAWLTGRRGWDRLWRSPGPNSYSFIASTWIWSVAMAMTDPFKAIYLSKLGLSHLAIGGFFALDMALRIGGVLLGGLVAQRYGHKSTLLLFDFISWTLASLVLAFATEPWHVYVATCLTATNALVAGSLTQLLVEDTPQERRTSMFALFSLVFVIPGLLLPAFSGWMVQRWGVVPVLRILFAAIGLATLAGTLWRRQHLRESEATTPKADLAELLQDGLRTAQDLLRQRAFWPVLGLIVLFNCVLNLNKAWQSLYITEVLAQGEAAIGQMASAGSLAFVVVTLAWVPRLRAGKHGGLFFWATLLSALPAAALAWARHPGLLLAIGAVGGLLGAVSGPLLSGHLAALLPPKREGLAQALISSVMQAAVALSLVLGGALFETRFSAYPWVMAGLSLGTGALAWQLWRQEARHA